MCLRFNPVLSPFSHQARWVKGQWVAHFRRGRTRSAACFVLAPPPENETTGPGVCPRQRGSSARWRVLFCLVCLASLRNLLERTRRLYSDAGKKCSTYSNIAMSRPLVSTCGLVVGGMMVRDVVLDGNGPLVSCSHHDIELLFASPPPRALPPQLHPSTRLVGSPRGE